MKNPRRSLTYSRSGRELKKRLVTEQKSYCLLCARLSERLELDHDHLRGNARAAICSYCNRGLGFFKDDPVLLRRAAAYLERFKRPNGKIVYTCIIPPRLVAQLSKIRL